MDAPIRPREPAHSALLLAGALAALLVAAPPASAQLNQTQHTDGWILAAAHAPGYHDSIWRTDLWVAFDTSAAPRIRLWFCARGADNTGAVEHLLEPSPDQVVVYVEDVVEHFLHLGDQPWAGAIRYSADGPVQVWARVYSVSADGNESYGQLVEGIPTADMSPDLAASADTDDHQWLYAMRHTADDRFRVNIGIVNPSPVAGSYRLNFYNSDGNDPPGDDDRLTVTVPPYSVVQLSDPFAAMLGGEWSACIVRVIAETQGTGTFAYASVVDNATNDAWFVRGVKMLGPTD